MDNKFIMMIASAMGREDGVDIYIDKLKLDIVGYVNGYISSFLGDESENNRILAERIMSDAPMDYLDPIRYIEIPRITAQQFLQEYINNAIGMSPFENFAISFQQSIGAIFNNSEITANDVFWGDLVADNFHEQFGNLHGENFQELAETYQTLFETTLFNLASKWLKKSVNY